MTDCPPPAQKDLDVLSFADALREIIPTKIKEIMDRMDFLEKYRKLYRQALVNLSKTGQIDEFGVYFWKLWSEIEYGEYFIQKRWLNYWLSLYEKLPEAKERPRYVDKYFDRRVQVDRVKNAPIENYYMGQLRSVGSRLLGKCPFHDEKTASFVIYTSDNTYHCFGACGAGGDVISYIMRLNKISFPEAIKVLL